jgi:hypothetical protein
MAFTVFLIMLLFGIVLIVVGNYMMKTPSRGDDWIGGCIGGVLVIAGVSSIIISAVGMVATFGRLMG